jgi:general secretion pathway protein F
VTTRFRYRASNAAGQVVEGVLYAPSAQTLLADLHRQRLYPVLVEEVAPVARQGRTWGLSRRAAVAMWSRNASTLLSAGVPLDRVLGLTAEHAGHTGLAEAVRRVRRAVQSGASLAEALEREHAHFGPLVVAMVAAGEASGALDAVFARLADYLEQANELRSQVTASLLYPALMATVASIGVVVLLLFVIPRFAAILGDVGTTLPLSTRLLVGASTLVANGWWVWLLLAAGLSYGLGTALQNRDTRRRWHAARLRWPVVGDLELKYATARFARTLGLLLRSGVPILNALRIARASLQNLALGDGMDRAAVTVAEGGALAPALAGTWPPLALQMLAVGEESGRVDEMCLRIADTYESEVRRALRTAVAMIEPVMILVFGALVGFIALAMLQAIYSINSGAF